MGDSLINHIGFTIGVRIRIGIGIDFVHMIVNRSHMNDPSSPPAECKAATNAKPEIGIPGESKT